MNHDELLARIENGHTFIQTMASLSALRAVVKLHQPHLFGVGEIVCSACEEWTNIGPYQLSYPCPTIQAIVEALG